MKKRISQLKERFLNWLRPMDKQSVAERLDLALSEWLVLNGWESISEEGEHKGLLGRWRRGNAISLGYMILNHTLSAKVSEIEAKRAVGAHLRNLIGMATEGRRTR